MKSKTTVTSAGAAAVAQQGAHSASKKPATKRAASPKEDAPTVQQGVKETPTRATATAKGTTMKTVEYTATPEKSTAEPGKVTKKTIVLGLLRRESGATLAELAETTGWKPNSVVGFVSGNLKTKMGLRVESSRQAAGRVYRIK